MLFGHNTNVTVGDAVYHVQTEDRGTASALLDTTVYCSGRVLHRRTNNYLDLLPLDAEREKELKLRLDEQHIAIIEELRSGALRLPVGPQNAGGQATMRTGGSDGGGGVTARERTGVQGAGLGLELVNARDWLAGGRARLVIGVRDGSGPVAGALVTTRIDGAAAHERFVGQTGADGVAKISFDMPKPTAGETSLVIEANRGTAHGALRFHLRAKAKKPLAG